MADQNGIKHIDFCNEGNVLFKLVFLLFPGKSHSRKLSSLCENPEVFRMAMESAEGEGKDTKFDSYYFSARKDCKQEDLQYEYDSESQKYKCLLCEKLYVSRQNVIIHGRTKHEGHFGFHCDICGKGFQRELHLRGHMATHGKPMQYECSICGSKYAHKTSLRNHERLAHRFMKME